METPEAVSQVDSPVEYEDCLVKLLWIFSLGECVGVRNRWSFGFFSMVATFIEDDLSLFGGSIICVV